MLKILKFPELYHTVPNEESQEDMLRQAQYDKILFFM